MNVTIVHVFVKPEHVQDFIVACRANHEASVQEAGNCRFDILQSATDPAHFVLYEAYGSVEAAAAHKQTSHYFAWREAVAGWMAKPRRGDEYQGLYPLVP